MNPIFHSYLLMWKHFSNFTGRTRASGFWMAFLCHLVVSLLCGLLGLGSVYSVIALVPLLAMMIRRLNDAGISWLWGLAYFIPVVGWVILAWLMCKPSR